MDDESYYDRISSASSTLYDLALGHENSNERYKDMEEVGNGVVKKIHRVFDLTSGRPVAMALPQENLSKDQLTRFLEEARLTASLEHPNIIQVYDLGFNRDGKPYFTMKLCSSSKLSDLLKDKTASLFQLMDVYLKICEAISYAHSAGAIHRDLKPENILLGNFGEVLVCDWGSAQIISGSNLENEVGQLSKPLTKGTPGFMSPEQEKGSPPAVSQDIYALGALLFNILTGQSPNTGETPSEIAEVPSGLEAVCLKAMSEDPANRYESVEGLIKDITAWMSGFAPMAEAASFRRQLKLFIFRHKALSLSVCFSLLVIAVISFIYIGELKQKEAQTRKERDRAENALRLYDLEKGIRKKIAALGADHFINGARQMVYVHSLDDAEELLSALPVSEINDKQLRKINGIKGRIAFYRQQFDTALEFFAAGEGEDKEFLSGVAKKFLKRKKNDRGLLSTNDTIELIDQVNHFRTQHAYGVYRYQILHYEDPHEQVHVIEKMILVNNEEIDKLNIKLTEDHGKLHLDVSNNPKLVNMVPIRKINLTSLNMANSPVSTRQFYVLQDMPLEEMNVSGSGIKNYSFIEDLKHLKRLIVNEKEAGNPSLKKYGSHLEIIVKSFPRS